jgi:hypothetical protein
MSGDTVSGQREGGGAGSTPAWSPALERVGSGRDVARPSTSNGHLADAYEISEHIGMGAFADVYRGTRRADGAPVAVKMLNRKSSPGWIQRVFEEVRIQQVVGEGRVPRHRREKNLMHSPRLYDYYTVPAAPATDADIQTVILVVELAAGGDLIKVLASSVGGQRNLESLTAEERYNLARRVLKALLKELYYLHANGIIHRDIKLDNVLVADAPEPKENPKRLVIGEKAKFMLADFGQAHQIGGPQLHSMCGTPGCTAPEVSPDDPHSFTAASDVWAAGCVAKTILGDDNACPHAPALLALIHTTQRADAARRPTAAHLLDGFDFDGVTPLAGVWKEGAAPGNETVDGGVGGGGGGGGAEKFMVRGGGACIDANARAISAGSEHMAAVTRKRQASAGGLTPGGGSAARPRVETLSHESKQLLASRISARFADRADDLISSRARSIEDVRPLVALVRELGAEGGEINLRALGPDTLRFIFRACDAKGIGLLSLSDISAANDAIRVSPGSDIARLFRSLDVLTWPAKRTHRSRADHLSPEELDKVCYWNLQGNPCGECAYYKANETLVVQRKGVSLRDFLKAAEGGDVSVRIREATGDAER